MRKPFWNILIIICLLFIFWFFTSCRSSKSEKTNQQVTGKALQQNDIETTHNKELQAHIEKIVHKALSEQIDISQKETEYDTDKPVKRERNDISKKICRKNRFGRAKSNRPK